MKVLAMTVCCVDLYPQQGLECVGGNSLNFATQCVRSGLREVAVLGAVGNDRYEPMIRSHLKKFKINASRLYTHPGATASNRIYIADEGERTFRPDSWQGGVYQTFRLSPEDWDFVGEHDIVAMPCLDPNFPEALERLKPPTRFVVDFLDTRDFALMEMVVPRIDLAFISGDRAVVERLKPLSREVGTLIVVTLGAEGSVALLEGRVYPQEAVPVANVVDTTGCGDAYQAAFTVSWFQDGDLKKAMEAGAMAASRVLCHFGGV